MKKKVRIISTVVSLCLVVATMCVGIWAATRATLSSTTSTLTFNADNVLATVTLTKGAGMASDENFANNGTYTIEEGAAASTTVSIPNMTFATAGSSKTFTVTVHNGFAENSNITIDSLLTVTTAGTDAAKFTVGITDDGTNAESNNAEATEVVAVGTDLIYTVTITYDENGADNTASATLNFTLVLEKTA